MALAADGPAERAGLVGGEDGEAGTVGREGAGGGGEAEGAGVRRRRGRRGRGVFEEADGRGEAGGGEDGEEVFGVERGGEFVGGREGLAVEEEGAGRGTVEDEGEAGAGGEGEAFAVAAGGGIGDGGGGPAFVGAGGVVQAAASGWKPQWA